MNGATEIAVNKYIAEYRQIATREARYFGRHPDITHAIIVATRSEYPPGKRHPHQALISTDSLEHSCGRLLLASSQIEACETFDDLYCLVNELINPINHIGDLTVYDIAHRIGSYLGLQPDLVYLHRGALDGAKALGIYRRKTLQLVELPAPFARLTPAEAEDCLCIFKREY